jgi:arginine/serine-rich splicing factor 16
MSLIHKCSNSQPQQPPASKGPYSQVGFSYDGDGKEEFHFSDGDHSESEDDDDDDEDFNSDDSNDEGMERIAKEFGVKRYGWLVYMDKKTKEEEKRQKEVIKGDPAIVSWVRLSFGISSCFLVSNNSITTCSFA